MEPTLGLLCGSGGGGGTALPGSQNGLSASKLGRDHMGMHKETEIELGLELSLGNGGGGGGVVEKGKGIAWDEYGKIFTAKDLPDGFSSNRAGVSAGTKRVRAAADCVEVGSASAAGSQVVGWPPVRAYRMNTLFNQTKRSNAEEYKGVGGNEKESSKKKINHGVDKNDASIKERGHLGFVKVNMDRLPIGGKVDLNVHKSYETLAKTMEEMFFNQSITISVGKEQPVQLKQKLRPM